MFVYNILGNPKKKKKSNKPKPSIPKSKNQVTLFVNYSYNGLRFPKVYKANRKLCAKLWNFLILYGGLYMNIPSTVAPAMLIIYQW